MKIGASLRGSDLKTKDAFAELDIAGYNYGILRYKKDIKRYPQRVIVGSETFCSDAYHFYEMAKKHPAIIGDFVWAGQDYLGEVGIGSREYKAYAKNFKPVVGWISAGSGRIDLTGKSLAEMSYMRVAYEIDPIRIGVIPVPFYRQEHSPSAWKMTTAIESWSFPGCTGQKTKVEVYARGYVVELCLNGKTIGKKRVKSNGRVSFSIIYHPGELKAISYAKDGSVIATTSLTSGEEKTILHAIPEQSKIGKGDLAYIRFKYADVNGILNPLARGDISLKVSGGLLLGFGHACPYNERGFNQSISDTYYGEALAIVKPTGDSPIEIEASSRYGKADTMIDVA